MSEVIVEKVSLRYPIYGANRRSVKYALANIATGGRLTKDNNKIKVKALDNVSFTLSKGDRVGLIGHNGAGKSTLLRILAGIYEPQQGTVKITGNISPLLDLHVGMEPEVNGYENARFRALMQGLSKKATQQTIEEIKEFTELGDFMWVPVKTYSAGMLMRLAFGISTSFTPDILLIDEVIGTGDNSFIAKAHRRLEDLIAKSNILVLSTHTPEIIQKFCDKVIWLEHGAVKAFGPTNEILPCYTAHTT